MKAVRDSKPWREAGLYLALTVMVSAIFYAFIIATGHVGGGNGVYELGLMWRPAAAALLACRLSETSIQSLGWKWRRGAITPYAIDEFGFVLPAAVLLVAVFFWNRGQPSAGS